VHPEYLPYIPTKDSALDKSNQSLHIFLEKIRAGQNSTLKRTTEQSEDYNSYQPSNREPKNGPTSILLGTQIQGVKISSTSNKKYVEQLSDINGMGSTHTSFEEIKEEISEIYS